MTEREQIAVEEYRTALRDIGFGRDAIQEAIDLTKSLPFCILRNEARLAILEAFCERFPNAKKDTFTKVARIIGVTRI